MSKRYCVMWTISQFGNVEPLFRREVRAHDNATGEKGSQTIDIPAGRVARADLSCNIPSFRALVVQVQRNRQRMARSLPYHDAERRSFANSFAQAEPDAKPPLNINGRYVFCACSRSLPAWALVNPMKELDRIISDESGPLQDPEC